MKITRNQRPYDLEKNETVQKKKIKKSMSSSSEQQPEQILYLSFNQDLSRVNCGTTRGFKIFDVNPPALKFSQDFGSGVGLAKALYKYNIVAIVGGGAHPLSPPNMCRIWDDHKKEFFTHITNHSPVLDLQMTEEHLVTATKDYVRVYEFKPKFKQIRKFKTNMNPHGIFDVSLKQDLPLVLTPIKTVGRVAVFDFLNDEYKKKPKALVDAHKNDVTLIRLNQQATKFATCSEKGTLIRVFDTDNFNLIAELRRGADAARIKNICFSDDSKFLLISSEKKTLHIYSLSDEFPNQRSSVSLISAALPSYFSSEWSLAQVEVPETSHIAGITLNPEDPTRYDISVFMYSGRFQTFAFYPDKSGRKHRVTLVSEGTFHNPSE